LLKVMRTFTALAVVVLLSTSARAEVFVARDRFDFSLIRSAVSNALESDLEVTPMGINAPYGIKRSSRAGQLESKEVTVLGEPYDLEDAQGGRWRLWVHSVNGPVIVVELVRARPFGLPVTESYQLTSVSINGEEALPTFPPLILNANGTYRLGKVSGRYVRTETGVTLDGVPAHFGKGTFWANLDGLTFNYRLGHDQFEVKYRLNQNYAAL
jgi:hypothetical protein